MWSWVSLRLQLSGGNVKCGRWDSSSGPPQARSALSFPVCEGSCCLVWEETGIVRVGQANWREHLWLGFWASGVLSLSVLWE